MTSPKNQPVPERRLWDPDLARLGTLGQLNLVPVGILDDHNATSIALAVVKDDLLASRDGRCKIGDDQAQPQPRGGRA